MVLNCFFYCFNITKRETFEKLNLFYNLLQDITSEHIILYLIGNKNDFDDQRYDSVEEVEQCKE
jgi:hypothetical protein